MKSIANSEWFKQIVRLITTAFVVLYLANIFINSAMIAIIITALLVIIFICGFISANKNNPKIPEMFLTFSEVKNLLIKRLDKDFTDYEVSRGGYWTVIRAVRKI